MTPVHNNYAWKDLMNMRFGFCFGSITEMNLLFSFFFVGERGRALVSMRRDDWIGRTQEPMNAAEENGRLWMAEEGATPPCEFTDWCKCTPYDSRELHEEVPMYLILCSNVNFSSHRLRRADVCMCSNDIYTIIPRRHNRQTDTFFLAFSSH